MKVYGFVPCKLDSKRLFEKNLQQISNRSLLHIAVRYLLEAKYIKKIFVSTYKKDVPLLKDFLKCYSENIEIIPRINATHPDDPLIAVYHDALAYMGQFDYLVSTTPDNPIKPMPLDYFIKMAIDANVDEIVMSDQHTSQKIGCLNILSRNAIEQKKESGHSRYFQMDGNRDIHTESDLAECRNYVTHLATFSSRATERIFEFW